MATKDANTGPDSSAGTKDAGDAETKIGNIVDASSSDATPDKGEKADASETPNIVRDVVDDRAEKAAAAASPAVGDETGDKVDDKSAKKEPDDENFSDVPFHKHPRFQRLLAQRNAATGDAVLYRNVQRFLDDNGMTGDEAANALTIFAQAKVDPVGAWAIIKPWVQKLLTDAGEVVPSELQARVTAGELTREAALEIGRERARANSFESRQKFQMQRQERMDKDTLGQSLVSTANDWQADRHLKDPNFEAKLPLIQKELAWLQAQEGKPDKPEGVRDQLNRSYKAVNETFSPPATRQPAYRKPPLRPVTGGQVAQNIRPDKPRSTLDIIHQVTAGRQAN